jgi:xanthine/uracil permease
VTLKFKYGLDDKLPVGENLLLGLQWLLITLPSLVIIGKIVADLHVINPLDQALTLQKMSFIVAVTVFFQIFWGHRLPLIAGPSTVLLIGVIASRGFVPGIIFTSMMIGGLILALFSASGLFAHLKRLFTPRVIAVVLLLVAFTLMPSVINLVAGSPDGHQALTHIALAFGLILGMVVFQKTLGGIWKSTIIIWAMLFGSLFYYFFFPHAPAKGNMADLAVFSFFFKGLNTSLSIEPGVLISFLFCFLALSVNDLGSIESMDELLAPANMPQRINRGLTFTGLANVLSGFFGVVGPVDYSSSPGVILSTDCASRFTLIPTALFLFLLSFSPLAMGIMGSTPPVVIGSVLLYILCFQVVAGLTVVFQSERELSLETGLIIGLPILLAVLIAFLPENAVRTFPQTLRPIAGNGFVVGIFTAFILEHLILRGKKKGKNSKKQINPGSI